MTAANFREKTVVVVSASTQGSADPARQGSRPHIGEVCAQEFRRRGASVIVVDGDEATLAGLAAPASGQAEAVDTILADPGDAGSLVAAARLCGERYASVDVLVTCHSEMEVAGIEETSAASWARIVNDNLLGPVFATKAFLPLLKRSGSGAIVHIGSIDGTLGNPQIPAYSASKGGLVPLTHVMADEFAGYGIRVNCVARAMFAARGGPANPRHAALIGQTPLARPAFPEEIAAAVCFLASSEASYVNGVVLPVDGGRSGITPGTRSGA